MDFFKQNIIPGEVIVQFVAFLIVFWALRKMAWQPILSALQERRDKIKQGFDRIEIGQREIETLKAEYASHLQKIEDEARSKLQEAVDEGRRIAREIQDGARKESEKTFQKAKENLEIEFAKARLELRREIADLAINVSARILKEEMSDTKKQEAKVLGIIEELEKTQ